MPLYRETQLNRGISANFNSNGGTELNWIWFRLESTQRRNLRHLSAGYSNSFLNVATPVTDLSAFYFHGRLVAFVGDLDLANMTQVQLQNAFGQNLLDGRQTLPGTIIYDSRFVNQITEDFAEPIQVQPGDILNIVLSPGLRLSDPDIFSYALHNVWLTVLGSYGSDEAPAFPFKLR